MIYDYGDDDDDDVGCGGSGAGGDDSGDDDVCGCQRYVFTQFFFLGRNFSRLEFTSFVRKACDPMGKTLTFRGIPILSSHFCEISSPGLVCRTVEVDCSAWRMLPI